MARTTNQPYNHTTCRSFKGNALLDSSHRAVQSWAHVFIIITMLHRAGLSRTVQGPRFQIGRTTLFSRGNTRLINNHIPYQPFAGASRARASRSAAPRSSTLRRPFHFILHIPFLIICRSFKGTRFQIGRTTLFNVEAPSGDLVGQAVTIREWTYEDGRKVRLCSVDPVVGVVCA